MQPLAAIIEICPAPDGTLPGALIRSAFEAAAGAPILLVLHGATPAQVDRVLDPVVRCLGPAVSTHMGVRYASLSDIARATVPDCELLIGESESFIVLALRCGLPLTPPAHGEAALARSARSPAFRVAA
jgi:hypothetical protein